MDSPRPLILARAHRKVLPILLGGAVFMAVVCLIGVAAVWGRNYMAMRDSAEQWRALEEHALELRRRAMLPGSALACLEAVAAALQDSCEKDLFASPQTVAAAVTYVTAQLSLLESGRKLDLGAPAYSDVIAAVRNGLERDRFGIVAHVAARSGCGPDDCDLFSLLQDSSRVRANLVERRFDSLLGMHIAEWASASGRASEGGALRSPPGSALPGASARQGSIR